MKVRSLILVGGLSSRMHSPKHALVFGEEGHQQCLLQKLLHHHKQFQVEVLGNRIPQKTTIAVRDSVQKLEVENLCAERGISLGDLEIVMDELHDSGPVAGLVAAFNIDPLAHWIVTGCDYPLLETETLQQLWSIHTDETWVTCFQNDEGYFEPLLAFWAPKALWEMRDMAHTQIKAGHRIGPTSFIRAIQRNQANDCQTPKIISVRPSNNLWIKNVNTPADWQEVLPLMNG